MNISSLLNVDTSPKVGYKDPKTKNKPDHINVDLVSQRVRRTNRAFISNSNAPRGNRGENAILQITFFNVNAVAGTRYGFKGWYVDIPPLNADGTETYVYSGPQNAIPGRYLEFIKPINYNITTQHLLSSPDPSNPRRSFIANSDQTAEAQNLIVQAFRARFSNTPR